MKLSIITINYNNASGLRKTIESVVNQTSLEFEYIVIDGASTDGSVEIIKEYKGKITFWVSEPDNGIYNAMNKGIKIANGEYCQFLNSGDYIIANNVTEKMLKDISGVSILYGNLLKQLPRGLHRDSGFEGKQPSMLNFFRSTMNHSSAYIKRSLFKQYGLYDESLRIVSDWKFFLQVIIFGEEEAIYKDLDMVVFDLNGISSINKELDKKERKDVLETFLPKNILIDYEKYSSSIRHWERVERYSFTRLIFWLIERSLFKLEKFKSRKKNFKIN